MKIEKLSKGNGNKKFIYGLILGIALIVIINILFSYSKFKAEDNIDLAEGTIDYVIPDLKLMAVYVKEGDEFVKKDDVPSDTIYQVVKGEGENTSYCANLDGNKIDNVYMKYENGNILINVNKKGTKCWIYLEKATLLNKDILAKNTPKESTYDEVHKNFVEFTKTATTDEGIYSMIDYDGEETYYFRGAVEDNYVKFAKNAKGQDLYWRIIRINSDGSIRMIYDGTSAHENGEVSEDRYNEVSAFNSVNDEAKYVGFMYGKTSGSYIEANKNEVESLALSKLNLWYEENLKNYENYLEKNAIFCCDRRSGASYEKYGDWLNDDMENKNGYGKLATWYGPLMRLAYNQHVDLSCQADDRFTPTDATKGNKSMKYPIGLITIEETMMAGALYGQSNNNFYLYVGKVFWTMSPAVFSGVTAQNMHGPGSDFPKSPNAGFDYLIYSAALKAVINLKANTTFSKGNGSIDHPYEIE